MNEREQPAAEFERAPIESDQNSNSEESFHAPTERSELATAYSRRSRRGTDNETPDAEPSIPAGAPTPDVRRTEFRVRDFRPEARTSFDALNNSATPTETQRAEPMRDVPRWTPPATDDDGRLSYRTQGVPRPPAPQAPPQAVVNSVPAEFAAPPRPMTRRELRELEVSQGTRPQADDAPAVEVPVVEIPAPPAPTPPAPAALAFPAATPAAAPPVAFPAAVPPPPAVSAQPMPAPIPQLVNPPVPQPASPPARPTSPPVPTQATPPVIRLAPPLPLPVPAEQAQEVSPEPVIFTDASGSAPQPAPAPTPSPAANRGIDFAPLVFTSPDVHAAPESIGGEFQPGDSFIRSVGGSSGSFTTQALVIPSIPQASDITRPFSSTGEILVTGSIDLPMSLGSTGASSARYDHSDIDALFAQEDHDYAPADSAPVRAIRAVSTHTSTHGVISAKKPASNRLPMMMAVTAGILAVGVAALFAAGMIFGYF